MTRQKFFNEMSWHNDFFSNWLRPYGSNIYSEYKRFSVVTFFQYIATVLVFIVNNNTWCHYIHYVSKRYYYLLFARYIMGCF